MSVDRLQVEAMARLAQLSVGADEAERIATEMSRILEHADRLRAVPGDGEVGDIAGLGGDDVRSAMLESGPVSRSGRPAGPDPLAHALAEFAPRFEQGFFVVPPPPGVVPETSRARGSEPPPSGESSG